jgi:hypothetical protein
MALVTGSSCLLDATSITRNGVALGSQSGQRGRLTPGGPRRTELGHVTPVVPWLGSQDRGRACEVLWPRGLKLLYMKRDPELLHGRWFSPRSALVSPSSADIRSTSGKCHDVWSGRASQDDVGRLTNVRAASMYSASVWSLCSGPAWVSARIQDSLGERPL